jgi:hypothetical protein
MPRCAICEEKWETSHDVNCPICNVNLCNSCATSVRWNIYKAYHLDEDKENQKKIRELCKECGDASDVDFDSDSD